MSDFLLILKLSSHFISDFYTAPEVGTDFINFIAKDAFLSGMETWKDWLKFILRFWVKLMNEKNTFAMTFKFNIGLGCVYLQVSMQSLTFLPALITARTHLEENMALSTKWQRALCLFSHLWESWKDKHYILSWYQETLQ